MTADAIEALTPPDVKERIKAILDGDSEEDIRPLADSLTMPTNAVGVPYGGHNYLLDSIAELELARAEGDPNLDDAKNLRRYRWRQQYHAKRYKANAELPILIDPAAETIDVDTRGDARAILASYLRTGSRLLAPSRAFDTYDGQGRIGSPAHCDRMDLEVAIGGASDEVKTFARALALDYDQRDMATELGVSQPTVSRNFAQWQADFYLALDSGVTPQGPARQRAKRAL